MNTRREFLRMGLAVFAGVFLNGCGRIPPDQAPNPPLVPTATQLQQTPTFEPTQTQKPTEEMKKATESVAEISKPLYDGGVLPKEIMLGEMKNLDNGAGEIYDTRGNLMLVREALEKPWVLAPFGYKLVDSAYYQWLPNDEKKWKFAEPDTTEVSKLVDELLVMWPTVGTLASLNPDLLSYHLDAIEGEGPGLFLDFLQAMLDSTDPALVKYLIEMGWRVGKAKDLQKLLEKSVGGPENKPYWMPALTPRKTPFVYMQGQRADTGRGLISPGNVIGASGGFYLDSIGLIAASHKENANNPWLRAKLRELSTKNSGHPLFGYLLGRSITSQWGMLIDPITDRMVFVVDHPNAIGDYSSSIVDAEQLGGSKETLRADQDARLLSAYYQLYLESYVAKFLIVEGTRRMTELMCVSSQHLAGCGTVIEQASVKKRFEVVGKPL